MLLNIVSSLSTETYQVHFPPELICLLLFVLFLFLLFLRINVFKLVAIFFKTRFFLSNKIWIIPSREDVAKHFPPSKWLQLPILGRSTASGCPQRRQWPLFQHGHLTCYSHCSLWNELDSPDLGGILTPLLKACIPPGCWKTTCSSAYTQNWGITALDNSDWLNRPRGQDTITKPVLRTD